MSLGFCPYLEKSVALVTCSSCRFVLRFIWSWNLSGQRLVLELDTMNVLASVFFYIRASFRRQFIQVSRNSTIKTARVVSGHVYRLPVPTDVLLSIAGFRIFHHKSGLKIRVWVVVMEEVAVCCETTTHEVLFTTWGAASGLLFRPVVRKQLLSPTSSIKDQLRKTLFLFVIILDTIQERWLASSHTLGIV